MPVNRKKEHAEALEDIVREHVFFDVRHLPIQSRVLLQLLIRENGEIEAIDLVLQNFEPSSLLTRLHLINFLACLCLHALSRLAAGLGAFHFGFASPSMLGDGSIPCQARFHARSERGDEGGSFRGRLLRCRSHGLLRRRGVGEPISTLTLRHLQIGGLRHGGEV